MRVLLAMLLLVGGTGYSITQDVQLTHTDQAVLTIPAKGKRDPVMVDLNPKASVSLGPYEVRSATMGANILLQNAINLYQQANESKTKASFVIGYVVEDLEAGKDYFYVMGASIPGPRVGGFNPPESYPKIELPK